MFTAFQLLNCRRIRKTKGNGMVIKITNGLNIIIKYFNVLILPLLNTILHTIGNFRNTTPRQK